MDRVGQLLDVERVHRQRILAQLLVRPRVLREDRHALAFVDDRSLLGHQVHAVEHRVHQQHVVVLVGRHRLLQVIAQLQLDRHPIGRAVTVVDDRHRVPRSAPDTPRTRGTSVRRGHQLGHERHPLAELRVLLEEQIERREAAQARSWTGPPGPPAGSESPAGDATARARTPPPAAAAPPGKRRLMVDRQRIGAHPHLALAATCTTPRSKSTSKSIRSRQHCRKLRR